VASPEFGDKGHDDRDAKGAEWDGLWGRVFASQPTRGSGGASWAPPAGSGAEPRPLSHFLHILGHRTLLVAKKYDSLAQSIRKIGILHEKIYKIYKIANSTLKKWWWQWPPLSKVVVTSHHRHAPMLLIILMSIGRLYDLSINKYQTSVNQLWLTYWQTGAISDWPSADHFWHFAATTFSFLQQLCTVSHVIFIWLQLVN